jgi:hypothetical protein
MHNLDAVNLKDRCSRQVQNRSKATCFALSNLGSKPPSRTATRRSLRLAFTHENALACVIHNRKKKKPSPLFAFQKRLA